MSGKIYKGTATTKGDLSHTKQKANDDGHPTLKQNSRRKIETSL